MSQPIGYEPVKRSVDPGFQGIGVGVVGRKFCEAVCRPGEGQTIPKESPQGGAI
jgi:hypothetical protein